MSDTKPDAAPANPIKRDAMSRLLFLLLAIVGGFAFYNFFLIERGTEHVSRRNFRTLAQIEKQIIGGFDRILAVANVQNRNGTLKIADQQYEVVASSSDRCTSLIIRTFGLPDDTKQPMCFRIVSTGENATLDLDIKIKKDTSSEMENLIVKNIRLSHFLNFSNSQEQFQQVLIFNANRQLMLRSSSDLDFEGNLDTYDQISSSITTHASLMEIPKIWNRNTPIKTAADKKADNENNDEQALQITKVQEFSIGKETYLAFVRPFKLPFSEIGHFDRPEVWYAVGITTQDSFNASRYMLPRWWTAMAVLGLLMLALTLPYIKLKLLGPHDLITTWTIIWAVLGLTAGMIIGTTMLFNLCSYHATEQKMVAGIESTGTKIAQQLNTEYKRNAEKLKRLFATFPRVSQQDLSNFERISFFDNDGWIYATTPADNVNFRRYSIADDQNWKELQYNRERAMDGSDLTFLQQTIESRIDGYKKTVLGMRGNSSASDISKFPEACLSRWHFFCAPPEKPTGNTVPIVAGYYRYQILDQIVLPKGFGFIVVENATGIVQYHSEEHAKMVERLYEETDNDSELKAAINAHQQRTFGTRYRGQLFLFSTHPLAYSDWTLITYFNRELLDRVSLGLLLTATSLSLGYFIILAAGLSVAFKLLSQTQVNHFWPNPRQGRAYARLSVMLALLALLEAIAVHTLHAAELLIVLLASPILALSGTYLCLVERYRSSVLSIFLFRNRQQIRLRWRSWVLQFAVAGSTLALLIFSIIASLKYTRLASSSPLLGASIAALLVPAIFLARWLEKRLIEILHIDQTPSTTTDRRSDRHTAFMLHRCCITLLVVIGVLLPTLAFFRDTTALHVLRWLQEDARKIRHQLERIASNPSYDSKTLEYKPRLSGLITYNTEKDIFRRNDSEACRDKLSKNYIYAPTTVDNTKQPQPNTKNIVTPPKIAALDTIMWPVVEIGTTKSLPLRWLKLAFDSQENPSEQEWLRCKQLYKKELVSILPLQHRDVLEAKNPSISPSYIQQRWHYSEIGLLHWYELWLGTTAVMLLVIRPMVRLVLRELVPESDLRPHPSLSHTELELLCDDRHGVVILISPCTLERTSGGYIRTLRGLENEIVGKLRVAFPSLAVHRLDQAMQLPASETPDVMVVAEYNWPRRIVGPSSQNIALQLFQHDISWKSFLVALKKLRLPDDFPGLTLNHWLPPRNFTLLICHSVEAQHTLLDFVVTRDHQAGPQPPQNKWQLLQPGEWASPRKKIWISHLEKILHTPIQRGRLLDFLENALQQPDPPAIVLTSLIMPHQWFTDPTLWKEQPPDTLERTRWLTLLASMDVRSVEPLTYEHKLVEGARARHALPRAGREAEYELWWEYSTPAEQIAMASLAHEGLINPLNHVVIRSLLARGIIFRQRKLRFCDHSFRQFVRYRLPATELHRRANLTLQGSTWGAVRGPLFITLAVLGYAVMAMGGGTVETMLALVTSIGASIPALLNLTRLLRSNGSS